jgi:hypothetical protein
VIRTTSKQVERLNFWKHCGDFVVPSLALGNVTATAPLGVDAIVSAGKAAPGAQSLASGVPAEIPLSR